MINTHKRSEVIKENIPVTTSDTPTPAGDDPRGIALRDREIAKDNPLGGILDVGKNMMDVAEAFGVDRKEIGKTILRSAISGKLDINGLRGQETAKRKKVEVLVDQIIKMSWTAFGIFMIFQVFVFVTTMVIIP